jgi:hypothetical protein
MATLWEQLERTARAALGAWRGEESTPSTPFSIYHGIDDANKHRVERYHAFWRYYKGNHRKHLKTRMTPAGPGPDDNVTINLSRSVVNKGVYFLFGPKLHWQLDESRQTQQEEMLDRIWRSDEWRQFFLSELAINGGVTGDFYIQIVPAVMQGALPRVVNLDPSIVFPHTNPDDIDDVWAFETRWRTGKTIKRTIHTKSETGATWETFTEALTAGRWVMEMEPVIWPFSWPYIVHGKNLPNPNEFFGCSDLEDADINDAINQVASNVNRITRIFAHPVAWAKGFGENLALDTSKIVTTTNTDAQMGALELARDLGSAQEHGRFLRTAFSEVTNVPESDPDRLAIGAQSGFALKVLFNDLVLKTGIKRSAYGMALIETNRRLLELVGMGDDNIVELHWNDALPEDERATAESDRFELDTGLASKETIATRRGLDWQTEQDRKQAENTSDGNVGEMLLRAFERGGVAQQ